MKKSDPFLRFGSPKTNGSMVSHRLKLTLVRSFIFVWACVVDKSENAFVLFDFVKEKPENTDLTIYWMLHWSARKNRRTFDHMYRKEICYNNYVKKPSLSCARMMSFPVRACRFSSQSLIWCLLPSTHHHLAPSPATRTGLHKSTVGRAVRPQKHVGPIYF